MKVKNISIRNFRRLEHVEIDLDEKETVFVGPNNSGKTSATTVIRSFLGSRPLKIHDFSVTKLAQLDGFIPTEENATLPEIQLDIWFEIDPTKIEFGRTFSLLPNISEDFSEVGMRCSFSVANVDELWSDYEDAYPLQQDSTRKNPLTHFLGLDNNVNKYFKVCYYSLEKNEDEIKATQLESSEGKRIINSLVRVDFLDAQRNIDDEELGRSTRLSSAFAAYYKKNLDQAETAEEAVNVIDQNNERLTEHYKNHFTGLMSVINGLGVPSVHDRELKLISSLNADTVLKGSTDLMYVDTETDHELPESYNGLGFKNLIFMAIQISNFHLQWINTEKDRPLCHLIFIEEPEVHLHAQVQQTFISNMWNLLMQASDNQEDLVPQLTITTHSSHILEAADFAKIRYFRRCQSGSEEGHTSTKLNVTEVHSLKNFLPASIEIDGEIITQEEALNFLRKYMKLTHCDLFFADAVVLIEGTVEKLLLPNMIEKISPNLQSKYLTVLEVGGAYAHRFAGLMEFLHIPYLVITDIDSVDPASNRRACRADLDGAVTSNASLRQFFTVNSIQELTEVDVTQCLQAEGFRYVSFQRPISLIEEDVQVNLHGRTLEETFIYENLDTIRDGTLDLGIDVVGNLEEIYEATYNMVRSSNFKKTKFALDILGSNVEWNVPAYIIAGLTWLEQKLDVSSEEDISHEEE